VLQKVQTSTQVGVLR